MTLCLPCAAEFVVVAGSAEGPAVPDPSPEFGHAMTIPASRAAGQINEFRIRISSSIPLFLDLRDLAHNGQRRSNLLIDVQHQVEIYVRGARVGDGYNGLLA